jgi:putative heme-binding domain-containing protein
LRHNKSPEMPELWAGLMVEYDGKDRWYLEALGIGADERWNDILPNLKKMTGAAGVSQAVYNDVYWRSRGEMSAELLATLAADKSVSLKDRLRYFRAFDFIPSKNKSAVLLKIAKEYGATEPELSPIALRHLEVDFVKNNAEARGILQNVMKTLKNKDYLEFADRYLLASENPRLLDMVLHNVYSGESAKILTKTTEGVALLNNILKNKKQEENALIIIGSLRGVGSKTALDMLQNAALDKTRSFDYRKTATEAIGGSWGGEELILSLLKNKKIEKRFIPAAVQGVSRAWRIMVRQEATSYLDRGDVRTGKKIPPIPDILKLKGDAAKGIELFKNYCANCHQVNGEGIDYGPKLSEIGSKLPKDGQLLAILYPDAGISFGYEGWDLKMKDGSQMRGLIASRTETDWSVKMPDGSLQAYKIKDIISKKQIANSMMPGGFHEVMTEQQLADLTEYLMGLRRK